MKSHMMKILGAAGLFAGVVNGHLTLAQPAPFGKPDNSPLSSSGSDFPCKLGQVNNFQGTPIEMASGSQQPLSFGGSAVHGGGSCQISLTKDTAPTKSSAFKVIRSFHGDCAKVDGAVLSYTIPPEVPDGSYTLAWTWFNRIGNREMYMNCAPVKVTGSKASDSDFNGLPDMAIYNLADLNACKTEESFDVQFPNPGKYVTPGQGFKPMPPKNCGSGGTSATGGSGASGSSGSFGEGAGGSGTSSANNGQYTGLGAASGNPGAGSPVATSLLTVYTTQTASGSAATSGAGNSTPSVGSAGTGSSSSSSSPGSPAGGATPGGSCSPDGSVVCSTDGTQYGLCNFGAVLMMPVSAGTKCSNGQIMRRADFKS